jgi:3-oxoadipate enol-lactonase
MPYFVTEDGCRIFFEITGASDPEGPWLVFLNGTGQTTHYWQATARHFEKDFRVLRYDARAQGQSELGLVPLSLSGHVEDLAALLDHLGIVAAHLVGLSHGGQVAIAAAQAYPNTVRRLVLCSVADQLSPRGRLIVRSWLETLRLGGISAMAWASLPIVMGDAFLKENTPVADAMTALMARRNQAPHLEAHLEAILDYPPPALRITAPLPCPCLVISGDDDPLVYGESARSLARRCGGRYLCIEGAGHAVSVEAPQEFNTAVFDFLTTSG